MTEIRNAEIANAETSNSIMSPLVGSEQQTSVQAPAMDVNSVVPPEIQQTAQNLSGSLYGSGFVEGGENQANRLSQELFNYDQQLEKGYSPYPKKDFYVENPADLYKTGSAYAGGMGGISGSVGKAVSGAELAYQTAVSAVLDKFTSFYKMKQDEEEARKDREERMDKEKREESLMLAKLLGGSYTDSSGNVHNIPGPKGTASEQSSALEQQAIGEIRSGVSLTEVIKKYAGRIDPNKLAQFNIIEHGALGETSEQQRGMGINPEALSTYIENEYDTTAIKDSFDSTLKMINSVNPDLDEEEKIMAAKNSVINSAPEDERADVKAWFDGFIPNPVEEEKKAPKPVEEGGVVGAYGNDILKMIANIATTAVGQAIDPYGSVRTSAGVAFGPNVPGITEQQKFQVNSILGTIGQSKEK